MAFTPASTAYVSVFARCWPLGRIHPRTRGILGINDLEAMKTLAMSSGFGGATFSMAVPLMGKKEMMMTAAGLYFEIISRALASPFSWPK